MIDTVVVSPAASDSATGSSLAGVSWPSIVAGAIVACALTLVLLAFGTGLGLTVVSPWAGSGVSATTFKIGTGLYLDRHCHDRFLDRRLPCRTAAVGLVRCAQR